MKNKIIIGIVIIIIVLLPSLLSMDSSNIKNENKLIANYREIYNLIKIQKLDGVTKVADGKISINGKQKKVGKEYISGMFNKTETGNIYGYLQHGNICVEQKYLEKQPKIYNKKCNNLELEKNSVDLINGEDKNLVADNDTTGLDKNLKFSSKYYYKGYNPSNYILFSNKCWRIINIANNNSIKIVYEGEANNNSCKKASSSISGSLGLYTWDIYKQDLGNWEEKSSLRKILYYWEKDGFIDNKSIKVNIDFNKLEIADWYIGSIASENLRLVDDIYNERSILNKEPMKLGLLNATDYLKVSCIKPSSLSTSDCGKNNYLYKENYNWWTLNNYSGDIKSVWTVMQNGKVENKEIKLSNEYYFSGLRIVVFLKSNITFIGNGTKENPYKVI